MRPPPASAHAFVSDLHRPVLEPEDRRHLERVLRLRPGETVTVSDGAGHWRVCRFGPALEPDGPVEVEPRPVPLLTVAFAPVKGTGPGGRAEWVVQKLTELGVDRIVPFVADRSVLRWDVSRAGRQGERLARAARQAAMQSRRSWLPEVAPLSTFDDVAALTGAVLAERAGPPPDLDHPAVLVGPEGGWSASERDRGLPRVGLGHGVLRAETASLAAAALLGAMRSGLVGPGAAAAPPTQRTSPPAPAPPASSPSP